MRVGLLGARPANRSILVDTVRALRNLLKATVTYR